MAPGTPSCIPPLHYTTLHPTILLSLPPSPTLRPSIASSLIIPIYATPPSSCYCTDVFPPNTLPSCYPCYLLSLSAVCCVSDGQGIRAAGASFGSVGTFGSGSSGSGHHAAGTGMAPREPFGVVTKQPPSPTERLPFGTIVSNAGTFGSSIGGGGTGGGGGSNTSKLTTASSLQVASQGKKDKDDDDDDGGSSSKPKLMTFADLGEVRGWLMVGCISPPMTIHDTLCCSEFLTSFPPYCITFLRTFFPTLSFFIR